MSPSGNDRRIRVAPTIHRPRFDARSEDGVTRRARLRIDGVDADYPDQDAEPSFAYVHLLQPPREGQPVVWACRGENRLTVFCRALMRTGGVAFVVTGLD